MTSSVKRAVPGRAVDTSAKLTAPMIQQVRAADYSGVIRYVPHVGSTGAHDIDRAELDAILDAGLSVMLAQHVRVPGWKPADASGAADAERAVAIAQAAGYGAGAHIFVDLEGISGPGEATKQYAEDWAKYVMAGGYSAGAYIGYAVPLNAQQLYDLHGINSYWSDLGPRQVATRGFALKQHATINIGGVLYDPNTIQLDQKGETPFWMTASADAANV